MDLLELYVRPDHVEEVPAHCINVQPCGRPSSKVAIRLHRGMVEVEAIHKKGCAHHQFFYHILS